MKRLKVLGMALVAVFAVGAVAVTSASAAKPEWSITTKIKTQEYTKTATLETKGASSVTCTKFTVEGEATTPKGGKTTITFKECESAGAKCNSTGQAAGVIKVETTGELVYLKRPAEGTLVGVRAIAKEAENKYVEFKCGLVAVKVRQNKANGGLVCPIRITGQEGYNKLSKKYTLTCNKKEVGVNEFTEYFEGETATKVTSFLESNVGGIGFKQSSEVTGAVEFEFEKEEEIKA
jgi:hypothetical protein